MLRRTAKALAALTARLRERHPDVPAGPADGRDASGGVRVLAVDWSGARTGAERAMWLAEVRDGALFRLECGRTREQLAEHLLAEAERDPHLVAGLDFAFSLPAWFLRARGLADGPALWALATEEAEGWLAACESPFWGRPGKKRPDLPTHLRHTDEAVPAVGGIRPKSVFQIGGAGAVGTGSLRGMPILHRLREAGFHVWPFDPPGWPLAVEIYPRLLTEAVTKSSAERRAAYLAARYPSLPDWAVAAAGGSEDAFDALISALVMSLHAADLAALPPVDDPPLRAEGFIWHPRWRDAAPPIGATASTAGGYAT